MTFSVSNWRGLWLIAAAIGLMVGGIATTWAIDTAVLAGVPASDERGELVQLWDAASSGNEPTLSLSQSRLLTQLSSMFANLATYGPVERAIEAGGHAPRAIRGARISASVFDLVPFTFRVSAFSPREDWKETDTVPLVISSRLERALNLKLGDRVRLDGRPAVVVGVTSDGFWFPTRGELFWVPFQTVPDTLTAGGQVVTTRVQAIARLRPGIDLATAAHVLAREPSRQLEKVVFEPYRTRLARTVLPPLVGVRTAGIFLAVAGTLNVTWMWGLRILARVPTLGIMVMLGASLTRLVTVLVREAIVAALLAAPVAVIVCWLLLSLLMDHDYGAITRLADVRLSLAAAVFGCLTAFGVVIVAAVPTVVVICRSVVRGERVQLLPARRARLRQWSLIAQVAAVAALTTQATLQAQTVAYLVSPQFLGFDSHRLLSAQLVPRGDLLETASVIRGLTELDRAVGPVQRVGLVSSLPLSGYDRSMSLRLRGHERMFRSVGLRLANAEYFELTGMRFTAGRPYTRPGGASHRALVVNTALAAATFGTVDAVGRRVVLGSISAPEWEIVGVVQAARHGGLFTEPRAEAFIPFEQADFLSAPVLQRFLATAFVVFRDDHPFAVPGRLDEVVEARLSPFAVRPLEQFDRLVGAAAGLRPLAAMGAKLLALIAVGLMACGLGGLAGQLVLSRRRATAIRVALGSKPTSAIAIALKPITVAVLTGLPLGVVVAVGVDAIVQGSVVGPPGFDRVAAMSRSLLMTAVAMLSTTLGAVLVPLTRAFLRNPTATLRES